MKQSFDWISAAIESCTNEWQLECCFKLIELFNQRYGDDGTREYDSLRQLILDKQVYISIHL